MTDYNIDFKDHVVQHPNRFRQVQVSPGVVDLVPTWIENPSEVIEEGTPVNAELFDKLRANVTRRSETFAATAGQTVFNLTKSYLVDQGRIDVYILGIKQRSGVDFTETSPTSFTLSEGLDAGTIVEAVYFSASQALSEDLIEQVQAAEAATLAASEAADDANEAAAEARSAQLNWKSPVATITALNALANPQTGDARQVTAEQKGYRYDGTQWRIISEMNLTPLTEVDNRLTSQLADIANQKANKSEVNELASDKADKTYVDQNLSILSSETIKYQDRGVLNLDFFDESTRAVIQGIEPGTINAVLGIGNVKPENTSFLDYDIEEINYFDENNVIEGGYLRASDGALVGATTWVSTDFVPINAGGTIKVATSVGGTYHLTFFDASQAFISGTSHVFSTTEREVKEFTAPANTAFFKIGVRTDEFATFFLGINGNTVVKNVSLKETVGLNIADNTIEPEKTTYLGRKNTRRINRFDKTAVISGGYYNNLGVYTTSATVSSSHFIPVVSNDVVRVMSAIQGNTHITYWDASGNFIAGDVRVLYVNTPATFYVPFNPSIAQMKIAIRNSDVDSYMVVINDPFPSRYWSYDELDYDIEMSGRMQKAVNEVVDNKATSSLYGLKWGVVGDSISTLGYLAGGNEYPGQIANEFNLTLNNLAIPGSLITKSNKPGHTDTHMCEKVLQLDTDCDVVTVAGGVNDLRYNVPLGVMGDTNIETFYGAMDTLCKNLIARFPNKPKAIFTPLKYRNNNENLKPYVNAIKEVAQRYAIPVLDNYSVSDLQPDITAINTVYFANQDGLHPNALGHEILARTIRNFLNQLV